MTEPLKVGIIGANAEGGWARDSHVPAVQGLDDLVLAAVATSTARTAEASAKAFGVPKAYGSGAALAADPDLDLVAVTTRVPDHLGLVLAAIAHGKHVYCEWPLGRSAAEAQEMADAAQAAGVHVAIGLQLRGSAVVREALRRLADGAIGRLLSMNAYASVAAFGAEVPAPYAYLEDPANFANLVTIQGAHTLDLVLALGGGSTELQPLLSRQHPRIEVEGDGPRPRTIFDHLLVQGRVREQAPVTVEVAGARPPETPFRLQMVGEAGVLELHGGAPRGFQSGRLRLVLNGEPQAVDEGEAARLPDGAANVAGVYAALRDDIRSGARTVMGFDHAVRLTRLIEDVLAWKEGSAALRPDGWPQA